MTKEQILATSLYEQLAQEREQHQQQLSAERERHLKSQETIMKMLDDSFNSKMKERERAGKLEHALKMCVDALKKYEDFLKELEPINQDHTNPSS